MDGNILKIRIILWSVLALTVVWLLYMAVVPSGRIIYEIDYAKEKENYFIRRFTPKERVNYDKTLPVLIGNPVYFYVYTPRRFEEAVLSVTYRDLSNRPYLAAGALIDKTAGLYNLAALENKILSGLTAWDKKNEGEITLWQRKNTFSSLSEFFSHPPALEKVAVADFDFKNNFKLDNYRSADKKRNIGPLRGDYEIKTYLKNETLDFGFVFKDINNNRGADPIEVHLYRGQKLLASKVLPDDGETGDTAQAVQSRVLELSENGLPEGVYRIRVNVGRDIITENITTKQNKIVFSGKVWPADSDGLKIYSSAPRFYFQTTSPAALQKIKINGRILDFNKTYEQFVADGDGKLNEIDLSAGDLIVAGQGVLAFSVDDFFNPDPKIVGPGFSPDKNGVDYIVAGNYREPVFLEDGWRKAQVKLDISSAPREKGRYDFMISAPELAAVPDNGLEIKEIKIELKGRSLFDFIKNKIKNF